MLYPIFAESAGLRVEGDAHVVELRPQGDDRRWFVTWKFDVVNAWFRPVSHGVLDAMVTAASPAEAVTEAYSKEFETDVWAMLMFLA